MLCTGYLILNGNKHLVLARAKNSNDYLWAIKLRKSGQNNQFFEGESQYLEHVWGAEEAERLLLSGKTLYA